jgi:hypothetical protein
MENACKDSWKTQPMPQETAILSYSEEFSSDEFEKISARQGRTTANCALERTRRKGIGAPLSLVVGRLKPQLFRLTCVT